ncbi:MAG: hypothetical protein ACFCUN_00705 [Hyphomicrobiaceae bacterium]
MSKRYGTSTSLERLKRASSAAGFVLATDEDGLSEQYTPKPPRKAVGDAFNAHRERKAQRKQPNRDKGPFFWLSPFALWSPYAGGRA